MGCPKKRIKWYRIQFPINLLFQDLKIVVKLNSIVFASVTSYRRNWVADPSGHFALGDPVS